MKAAGIAGATAAEAERQLKGFIDKFEPAHRRLIRGVRRALRKRLPRFNELVYDNYNFFVIGYGPTERPSEAIISLVAGANGVSLCFLRGATLRDPGSILRGSGNQTRFLRLESVEVLSRPDVDALVTAALSKGKTPAGTRRKLIIRSVSAKQRARR
jgi:hypothetical protein